MSIGRLDIPIGFNVLNSDSGKNSELRNTVIKTSCNVVTPNRFISLRSVMG